MIDSSFHIWIDGDSFPRPIREIVYRAVEKRNLDLTVVANRSVPPPPQGDLVVVSDVETADEVILQEAKRGDLVITRDIPLAERVLERGIDCMNDRGELFTLEDIGRRRSERDRMEELRRATGISMGKRTFGPRETKAFADTFDRYITGRLISRS